MPFKTPPSKFIAGVERIVQQSQKVDSVRRATVISVPPHGTVALVRIGGAKTIERAEIPSGQTLKPGDSVIITRPREGRRWVILMSYIDDRGGFPNVPNNRDALASPDNFTGLSGRGFIALLWNTPPGYELVYEIEIATDPGTYLSTTTEYVVGGAYVEVVTPGTQKAYRVRSVSTQWKKSGWTAWTAVTSSGLRTGLESSLPSLAYGDYWATDTNTLYIGDGTNWNAIGGGGGSTIWDVDAVPESPGTIDDEFDDSLISGWTEYDSGAIQTPTEASDVISLAQTTQSLATLTGYYATLPGTTFTAVTKMKLSHDVTDAANELICGGIVLWEDATDANADVLILGLGSSANASGSETLYSGAGYMAGAVSSFSGGFGGDFSADTYYYIRVRSDAANVYLDRSNDGLSWSTVNVIAVGSYTHIGFGMINKDLGSTLTATFEFFRYRNSFDAVTDPCYGNTTIAESGNALYIRGVPVSPAAPSNDELLVAEAPNDAYDGAYVNDGDSGSTYPTHRVKLTFNTDLIVSKIFYELADAGSNGAINIYESDGSTLIQTTPTAYVVGDNLITLSASWYPLSGSTYVVEFDFDGNENRRRASSLGGTYFSSAADSGHPLPRLKLWAREADTTWKPKTATITTPIVFSSFIDRNQRNLDVNMHGGLAALATSQTLNSGSPVNVTAGGSKIMIVVTAGTDTAGTITITGTSYNRDTGSETGSDTDNIVISGTTTDSSTTDAQSNPIHDFSNAYISSKWFKGSLTISTTDTDCTISVYSLAFEQMNDNANAAINTIDLNTYVTNSSAWLYVYAYIVNVTGSTVAVSTFTSLSITAADSVANAYHRRRRGNLAQAIDGTTDGFFLDIFFGPSATTYFDDVSLKVWGEIVISPDYA